MLINNIDPRYSYRSLQADFQVRNGHLEGVPPENLDQVERYTQAQELAKVLNADLAAAATGMDQAFKADNVAGFDLNPTPGLVVAAGFKGVSGRNVSMLVDRRDSEQKGELRFQDGHEQGFIKLQGTDMQSEFSYRDINQGYLMRASLTTDPASGRVHYEQKVSSHLNRVKVTPEELDQALRPRYEATYDGQGNVRPPINLEDRKRAEIDRQLWERSREVVEQAESLCQLAPPDSKGSVNWMLQGKPVIGTYTSTYNSILNEQDVTAHIASGGSTQDVLVMKQNRVGEPRYQVSWRNEDSRGNVEENSFSTYGFSGDEFAISSARGKPGQHS